MSGEIYLIDGNSLAYRAFYALPASIMTSSGTPTNSVYGFVRMLLRIIGEEKPEGLAVAFDSAVPTFRHQMFKEYKATRKKMPDELAEQMKVIEEVVEAFGIRIFRVDGYEADDVLATLAKKLEQRGKRVVLVTGDKDALQLVDENIRVMATKKGVTDVIIYDSKTVLERYGISPSQVCDFFALAGDTSDNIPGVRGVGEKTAAMLINLFGSVENLLENLDKIPSPKLLSAVKEASDQILKNKELLRLKLDVPVEARPDDLRLGSYDMGRILRLFEFLEFKSLIPAVLKLSGSADPGAEADSLRLPGVIESSPPGVATVQGIVDRGDLDRLLELSRRLRRVAVEVDSLTDDILEDRIKSVRIHVGDSTFLLEVERLRHRGGESFIKEVRRFLKELLEDGQIEKIFCDCKPQIRMLRLNGIRLAPPYWDIALADYLLRPASEDRGAASLAKIYCGVEPDGESAATGLYERIRIAQEGELRKTGMLELYLGVDLPFADVLARMEINGIAIDKAYLESLVGQHRRELIVLEEQIYDVAKERFNINSTQQLADILFKKLKLEPQKKTKTGYSTSYDALKKLLGTHPIIELILRYRELYKLLNTYIDPLPSHIHPKTGRIHTSYNQMGTATGRLSSSNPNLQNIPIRSEVGKEIRRAFVSDGPGSSLVSADYSQIELRVLAYLSGDQNLISAFKRGEDVHARTAAEIFGIPIDRVGPLERRVGKTINFGMIYGMSNHGLSEALSISHEEASKYIEAYFARFGRVKEFLDELVERARQCGYATTMFGRRRYIPELASSNQAMVKLGERIAMNSPLQGSAADIMKIATLNLQKRLDEVAPDAKIVLQVHDELLLEAPDELVDVVAGVGAEEMEHVHPLGEVGLKVDVKVGKSWYF